jgi:hypothetical protein
VLQPQDDSREGEHREVVLGALLVAGRDAPVLLEAINEPFDPIALSVRRAVERVERCVTPIVGALIAPARDDGTDAPSGEGTADARVAVALVADELRRAVAGSPAARPPDPPAGEQGIEVDRLVACLVAEPCWGPVR